MKNVTTHPTDKTYDLAIIGAGIAGAAIARDAVLRGLSVVVFEKSSPGSGTSSKSSKLIHGGIRYLELGFKSLARLHLREAFKHFRFVATSLREARTLQKIAPSLVHPISLLMPLYKGGRPTLFVYAGACLYSLFALFSGDVKPPKLFSRIATLKELPQLNPEGLRGAVRIWDRCTDDRKLVEATLESAKRHGADVFTQTEVTSYFCDNKGRFHLHTRSAEGERPFTAEALANASGPWSDTVRASGVDNGEKWIAPVGGSHLEFKKFLPVSTLLEATDGRIFFAINYDERTRVGTTERSGIDPDKAEVSLEEKAYLLKSLNRYFPAVGLSEKDIVASDCGVRPLTRPKMEKKENEISREHEVRRDASGALHVLGVKLTDHRRVAQEVVNRIRPESRNLCRTQNLPLDA